MNTILYYNLSLILGGVIALISGFVVFYSNPKKSQNISWFLLTISTAVWSFGYFMMISASNRNIAFLSNNILHGGAILIPIFYFIFIIEITENYNKYKKKIFFISLLGAIFFILNPTKLFIDDVFPKFIFNYAPNAGPIYIYFTIYFFAVVIYSLFILSKSLKNTDIKIELRRLKLIFYSSLVGFSGGGSVFFLTFNINFPPYLIILFSLYPVIIAYAITRYRLMNIIVIIRRGAVYVSTTLTLTVFSLALFLLMANFLYLDYNNLSLAIAVCLLILSLTLFPYLKDAYTHFANKYFFASLYETEQVFQELVKKIPNILNLDELLDLINHVLTQTFKMEKLGVWFINTKKEAQALKIVGFTSNDNLSFIEDKFLLKFLDQSGKPLLLQEIEQIEKANHDDGGRKKFMKIHRQMRQNGASIILPLIVKKELVGLIVLGPKLTAEDYTAQDIEMLEILANQSAVAIENAELYTESKHFGKIMKQEVIKATENLKKANQQLKRLDAAKSEFISIASHQLRTPLTAIKGYISMMMDGDFGEVNSQLAEPLKRVYISNQRLIDLVENLLNISRMESGRMKYYFERVALDKLIENVTKDLKILADRKGIYLKYNKPAKSIAKFFADQEKLRQIVMNLIDNAIKYTKVGGITVTVREKENTQTYKKKIIFMVEDTGIGIDKEDMTLLFQKFERGKGVSLIHTEGTGLGLYVCKQLTEAHQGTIKVESKGKNKGSRFTVEFPVLAKPPKAKSKPISPLGQPAAQIAPMANPTNLKKLPEMPEKR